MADNTLQSGADTIATDDIGGVKYQRVKATFGVDGVAVDVSATDPLPVGLYGQTVTGTITAAGQTVTIADLRGAATVTLEGIVNAVTAHSVGMEVLTASGVWEPARWIFNTGSSGAISLSSTVANGSSSVTIGGSSLRAIADVAGYVGCRLRSSAFTGTSFAVTMVTSYAPTTRIGPDVESTTARIVSVNQATPGSTNNVALNGQTVTGTLTAAGSVTINDLFGAATVTLEGVASSMTTNISTLEVLTASGIWEVARWIYTTGTSGAIGPPLTAGSGGISFAANSARVIADVAGFVGCRFRCNSFAGTSFAVTMVTSYAPTTRIGPDVDPLTNTVKWVSLSSVGGNTIASMGAGTNGITSGTTFPVAASASMANTTDVASAVRTTTGNSGAIADALGGAISGTLNVTAVSGTTPTLDLILQESPDFGTTWVDVYHFERVTAVGVITMPSVPLNGRRRWSWTMTGTTPSFTFSISSNRGGFAQFPRFVQVFDRTAGLLAGTLNAVSATYQLAGCRGVIAAVTLAAATTPATYKLQGSADGSNWYDMAAAVVGVANSTIVIANTGNTHARFARVLVSVAGATQTGVVVAITGTD